MAYRSEIELALDEMISDETGMRFQGIAVIHAQQKWPQLVACERKKDGGLDAHADGESQPDGKGIGLACSIRASLKKFCDDAEQVKKHHPDVQLLIFSTAEKVGEYEKDSWGKKILEQFGLQLVVVSREEFISWLRAPAQADICRELGIAPPMGQDLEPAFERAQKAAQEIAVDWDRAYRKPWRPVINLSAFKLDEQGSRTEAITTDSLGASLGEGQRIILEAPAGSGKTTTLVQFARRVLSTGGLAFLVDLPGWGSSHKDILAYIAGYPPFAGDGLDANLLSKLRGKLPLTFLMNGWNEVSIASVEEADIALRGLVRSFPAAIIIVATRTHRHTPPLDGALRVELSPLGRAQRNEYLDLVLGKDANGLKAMLDSNRVLHYITRTPLILAEVADLYRSGKDIPPTKLGVLAAVVEGIEQSTEHRVSLQQAPLWGHAVDYLRALSMTMSSTGETELGASDALDVVNSVSAGLRTAGQTTNVPQPDEILNELSKRHVLVQTRGRETSFRFQHQQYQEFFAAGALKTRLLELVKGKDPKQERNFQKWYVNEPRWEESLLMLAEDIGGRGEEKLMVEAGVKLVRLALEVDPIFAGALARRCGPAIWSEVRNEIGVLLRAWYDAPDPNHKQCALAAMLATGSDDFKDIVVPLLTSSNAQFRLAVYHSGAEFLPSSLGSNWSEIVRGWPEDVRLDFVLQLADDPWLSDKVEQFALSDPSAKVKWNIARRLSWYGYTEKVERLLESLNGAGFREAVRALDQDEIPKSQWPRAVIAYEQRHKESSDPFERLRLLRILQTFGGTNIVERMKDELDGLGPDQLKPGETQGEIRWSLDELQKSDPKWVSEWAARKVLDKSIWFGACQGLIAQISNEEREALYLRFSTEVLDQGEQQRVVSVLVSVMDSALAARVLATACEIRAGLTPPPGHDQAKWNLFRQVEDLLRVIRPEMLLESSKEKLENEPDVVELDILTEILPATNVTKPDVRSSIPDDMRARLRDYFKRAAKLGADPDGLRASTRARLAQLLANVGEREDLKDIRRLIAADSVRFEKAHAARLKGDRSQDSTGYGFLYLEAVTTVDPTQADGVIVELIRSQQYEHVLAQRLPLVARKSEGRQGFGTNRMDFKKIWKSRAGEPDEAFVEDRRVRFADEIREQIDRIKGEAEAATDRRGFDYRLKILGGALAALDGKRSAKLILELMELQGRWDGWTRVGAVESLLSWGVQLRLGEVLRVFDPVIQELRASGIYSNNQNASLFARCLSVMAFVDPPAKGIAKIRELISELRFRLYELDGIVAALGASRCDDAIDVLMEFAGADGKGAEAVGESWLEAIGALEGVRSSEILLSFVDPNVKLFNREFIPDHRYGDLLARLLAERAAKDKALKGRLVELANGDLPQTKRMLLAKVFGQFDSEEDRVLGLSILRDDGSGIPYELFRSLEEAFLERRPYGPGSSTVTLAPRGSNVLRRRLFEMSQEDALRKRSAIALLGQIEVWRLEYGRPDDEPRHPLIESEVPWPPLLS
jgi:NACHT conflict system protein